MILFSVIIMASFLFLIKKI
ncbi:MAG: sortase B protein-sorting domain-containing protein [Clostridiales bacterium]|nr:sortase B protein-sorting domain-containing protein [Clostridiales bacterium]